MTNIGRKICVAVAISACTPGIAEIVHGSPPAQFQIAVNWSQRSGSLKTIPTLQVVVNPLLRRESPIHDAAFAALKDLGADYVRFVPWFPYPKLAVAELEAPRNGRTSWNFSLIDPLAVDFLQAVQGHPAILNFSTQPAWMFRSDRFVNYPSDPDKVVWDYIDTDGRLNDPTGRQLAEYYGRLVSWYTQGGFTDEYGRYHKSGHHFMLPYWEVLNEPDGEHKPTPQEYTLWYDAIVAAIGKVSPKTKFIGLALTRPDAEMFEYFLNPHNHRAGTPLDMISYHFYASPGPTESLDQWQYSFFSQADQFISQVRFIELIRKRLSPSTHTTIDEIGSILSNDSTDVKLTAIPAAYWNLSGATYAYLFMKLSALGIDILGESQLVGYPTQYPDVTMIDWVNGKPNARYWVLKLIKQRLIPGDELHDAVVLGPNEVATGKYPLEAQGYHSANGERKVLIVNERNRAAWVALGPDAIGGRCEVVDESSGENPARVSILNRQTIVLAPFAVAVVTLH